MKRYLISIFSIVAFIIAIYGGTLNHPFVLDDLPGILGNDSIRHLWSKDIFQPPQDTTVMSGRPLPNFTLALNYALGGLNVQGYHLFNIFFHILTALMLFGIIRQTLSHSRTIQNKPSATPFAFVAALLWSVHPLATSAVTYTVQRAEILVSLFYLATLYGLIRSTQHHPVRWKIFSVIMCGFGMLSKEVMATAPMVVLLYDRTFLASSFREIFQKRWKYYISLGGTWLILIVLMLHQPWRGGAVGFSEQIHWPDYLQTQAWAVTHYIRLILIPYPLVFDYGRELITNIWVVIPSGLFLIALIAGSLWVYRRKPWLGFLGLAFFIILAPTSSFVPLIYQTIAEHRVYLASSLVIILLVSAVYRFFPVKARSIFFGCLIGLFALLTFLRNMDYRSPLLLWHDTVLKRPNNERALNNRGNLLVQTGYTHQALQDFTRAIEIYPSYAEALNNRANVLAQLKKYRPALADYTRAIELKPDYVEAWHNRANVHFQLGENEKSAADFTRAIQLKPDLAIAYLGRGKAFLALSQTKKARDDFYRVISIGEQQKNLQMVQAAREYLKKLESTE